MPIPLPNLNQATLRLFNVVQITDPSQKTDNTVYLERCIRNGYILDASVVVTEDLLETIETVIGLSGEKGNAAFHKSWKTIQETSLEVLFLQQLCHYMTTYGAERMGIYDVNNVYIPNEILEIPDVEDDISLVVIKACSQHEMEKKVSLLAGSGIALSQTALDDIMTIVTVNKFPQTFLDTVANRELRIRLFDHFGIAPKEPMEYLRYLVFKTTSETLLIKNKSLIDKLKLADAQILDPLLDLAPIDLASVFLRNKPLFLALKTASKNKTFFNRLNKKAKTQHIPLPIDYLNSITSQIQRGVLDLQLLEKKLQTAGAFRKVRLLYALQFRLQKAGSILRKELPIVYQVRNGKGWATETQWDVSLAEQTLNAYNIVLRSITSNIAKNVSGKTVYIPKGITYALPATEKQFIGNLPSGTHVEVAQDLIFGVHWVDSKKRIDLDLSVISASGKVGWDASYRTEDNQILFSGDNTSAPPPLGASELFYFKMGQKDPFIVNLNYFNFALGSDVECTVFVANEEPEQFDRNYVVDPNNIVLSAKLKIDKKQTQIGLVMPVAGKNRYHFCNVSVGNSISATGNVNTQTTRDYFVRQHSNPIDLSLVLSLAGATVVTEKPIHTDYLDLSPTAIDKSTIINLLI